MIKLCESDVFKVNTMTYPFNPLLIHQSERCWAKSCPPGPGDWYM